MAALRALRLCRSKSSTKQPGYCSNGSQQTTNELTLRPELGGVKKKVVDKLLEAGNDAVMRLTLANQT
jgi:hypothetical protein